MSFILHLFYIVLFEYVCVYVYIIYIFYTYMYIVIKSYMF